MTTLQQGIVERYGDAKSFMFTFSPVNLIPYTEDVERCHMGTAPTLSELRKAYGGNVPVMWLMPFLYDIQEYCGTKTKWSTNQLSQLAHMIVREYFYLKVTELMLFFVRFKGAHYGRFYGVEDPMVVMESIKAFIEERGAFYDSYCHRQEREAIEERKRNAISYEEYLRMKERGVITCI